jgi:membrane-associated protease RseP (regulator of RpoE activity)
MELALYSLAALLVWIAAIVVFHLTIAFVGTFFGIRVREVGIGYGPTVLKKVGPNWTFRVAAIPLAGYTQFHGFDDLAPDDMPVLQDGSPQAGGYRDASPLAQMLTVLSGPLAVALLGVVCIAAPIWVGARQLEACSSDESFVHPCGVRGLRLGHEPVSWQSQIALFRDTAVEFTIRLATFRSLDGWGALVAFFLTAGGVGVLSFAGWLSSIGVLLLWVGAFNLLPVPGLNGFQFLLALGRWASGRALPEKARIAMTYVGLLAILVFSGRVAWVDLRWLWRAWVG